MHFFPQPLLNCTLTKRVGQLQHMRNVNSLLPTPTQVSTPASLTVTTSPPFQTHFARWRGACGWEIRLQPCLRTARGHSPAPRPSPQPTAGGTPPAPCQGPAQSLPAPARHSPPSCGDSSPLGAEVGEAPKHYGHAPHQCKRLISVLDDYTLNIILTLCVERLQK